MSVTQQCTLRLMVAIYAPGVSTTLAKQRHFDSDTWKQPNIHKATLNPATTADANDELQHEPKLTADIGGDMCACSFENPSCFQALSFG